MTEQTFKQNIFARSTWKRGIYMVLFALIYNVAEMVMIAVALFQFATKLLTGTTNPRVLEFGQSLSLFIYRVWRFMTFNSESLPFPFAPWPDGSATNQDLKNP